MTSVRAFGVWLFGCVLASAALAHAVRHEVMPGDATAGVAVVALRFTDGEPFAFERYELFHGPAGEPVQTGQTDALGRLALLPGERGAAQGWRLRAFSADGHGIDTPLQFDSVAALNGAALWRAAETESPRHWQRAAWGVGVIFGLGFLLRRALRRRRTV